jgi:hypothetical protein
MLMTTERRPAIRALRGWAISVLQDASAIRECEEHLDGWLRSAAGPDRVNRRSNFGRRSPGLGGQYCAGRMTHGPSVS